MLNLIRFIVKSLTRFVRVSYNIDKSNIASTRHAVLSSHDKKVDVFHKGLKEYRFRPNHYCSYCLKPIPAGSRGFIHSGYGTEQDVTADKGKLFLHASCVAEITGNEEILNDDYKGGNQDRAPFNDIITALVIDFTTRFTSEELFHQGQERNLVFIPVNTVSDLLIDPQLEASNFWFDIDHAEAGELRYPLGVFDSDDVSPSSNPAPHLGQDNEAILGGELGLSETELSDLRSQGVI